MKIFSKLTLRYGKEKEAKTVYYALKPDNILIKEGMVIRDLLEHSNVKIIIELEGDSRIIGTLYSTLNEILAHVKSIETLLRKLK